MKAAQWESSLASCDWFSVGQLTVEGVREGVQQVRDGVLHADVSLQLGAQRRHAFILDAARHDVREPRQVGVTVQRHAVRRDVATAVDPDGADLIVSDPNAGVRRRRRFDAEPAADGDDRLLQLANVPTNTLLEGA